VISFFLANFALIALLPILGGAMLYIERTCRNLGGKQNAHKPRSQSYQSAGAQHAPEYGSLPGR
jgi:hypothetical protein